MLIKSPLSACGNSPSRAIACHAELGSQRWRGPSFSVEASYLPHLIGSDLGFSMGRTACLPSLGTAVVYVVLVCPFGKMLTIATQSVIAGVENEHRVWVLSLLDEVGHAMGQHAMGGPELPVSGRKPTSSPAPAVSLWALAGSLVHLRPEAGDIPFAQRRQGLTIDFGHVGSSIEPIRLTDGGVSAPPSTHHHTPHMSKPWTFNRKKRRSNR